GPMLAVILAGLFTRWASAAAAKAALILGPLFFYALVFGWADNVQAWLRTSMGTTEDVHFLHFLGVVFVVTCVIMVVISWLSPQERRTLTPTNEYVDMTPWRWSAPVGGLIVAITIGCYWLLAR